jgi:hypothetical protein
MKSDAPHPFTNPDPNAPYAPPPALDRPRNGAQTGDGLRVDHASDSTAGGKVSGGKTGTGPDGRTSQDLPTPAVDAHAPTRG